MISKPVKQPFSLCGCGSSSLPKDKDTQVIPQTPSKLPSNTEHSSHITSRPRSSPHSLKFPLEASPIPYQHKKTKITFSYEPSFNSILTPKISTPLQPRPFSQILTSNAISNLNKFSIESGRQRKIINLRSSSWRKRQTESKINPKAFNEKLLNEKI